MTGKSMIKQNQPKATKQALATKTTKTLQNTKQSALHTPLQSKTASKLSSPDSCFEAQKTMTTTSQLDNVDIVSNIIRLAQEPIKKDDNSNYSNKSVAFWSLLAEKHKDALKNLKSDSLKKYWRQVENSGNTDSFLQQLEEQRAVFQKYQTPLPLN